MSRLVIRSLCVAGGLLGLVGQQAWAQQDSQRYQANRPIQIEADADETIARMLSLCFQSANEIASLAADQAESSSVRQFAEELIDDHQRILSELDQFSPGVSRRRLDAAQRETRTRSRFDEPLQSDLQRRSGREGQPIDMLQVAQEIAQEHTNLVKRELRQREGLDFDWAFLGQQLVAHQHGLAQLRVVSRYASPELRDVLQLAMNQIDDHMQRIEELMDRLERLERNRQQGQSG